jgi:hypothetical protein
MLDRVEQEREYILLLPQPEGTHEGHPYKLSVGTRLSMLLLISIYYY